MYCIASNVRSPPIDTKSAFGPKLPFDLAIDIPLTISIADIRLIKIQYYGIEVSCGILLVALGGFDLVFFDELGTGFKY
jgi:hypothetical protein